MAPSFFGEWEVALLLDYLRDCENQPYSVAGYLKDGDVQGTHCSQLCAEVLDEPETVQPMMVEKQGYMGGVWQPGIEPPGFDDSRQGNQF